jgi:hypothetical protein
MVPVMRFSEGADLDGELAKVREVGLPVSLDRSSRNIPDIPHSSALGW